MASSFAPPAPVFLQSAPSVLFYKPFVPGMTMALLPQLADTNRGKPYDVQIKTVRPVPVGRSTFLDLSVFNPSTGRIPAELKIVHEKPAHIFIVNEDLSDFQHVHPIAVHPGVFRVPALFKASGPYTLFLQFTTPQDGEQTLNKSFLVGNRAPLPAPLVPDAHLSKSVDGYTFRVSGLPTRRQPMAMFNVEILKDGVPVRNIQPYLGAGAHGVIISQDRQSFVHTHPMTEPKDGLYQSPVMFHTNISRPGLYKMWIQTQIDGKIHTVDWTFRV